MIENINLTLYIVLAVLCYVFLILFAAINIFDAVGNYYIELKGKIKNVIVTSKTKNLFVLLKNRVYLPILLVFKFLFRYLLLLSESFHAFDELITIGSRIMFEESIEYTSLTLRKIYEGNIQSLLVYSSSAIVVFYIILSVF